MGGRELAILAAKDPILTLSRPEKFNFLGAFLHQSLQSFDFMHEHGRPIWPLGRTVGLVMIFRFESMVGRVLRDSFSRNREGNIFVQHVVVTAHLLWSR